MAHRSIGRERSGFAGRARPASSLDELAKLIDWSPVAALLDPLHSASKGEPAWSPLTMFKALLLSIWYDLSDVKLAEAPDDRPSTWVGACPATFRRGPSTAHDCHQRGIGQHHPKQRRCHRAGGGAMMRSPAAVSQRSRR